MLIKYPQITNQKSIQSKHGDGLKDILVHFKDANRILKVAKEIASVLFCIAEAME